MENITVNGFNIRIDRISSLGEALWEPYSKDEVRGIYESKGIGLI